MTALSIAYPLGAAWYFWHDWFKFARRDGPFLVGLPGVAVPVNEWMITWLSPWRVVMAWITARALASAAKKLRAGEADGGALSILALFGLVLPQSFWLFEFVNDWHGARGLDAIALGAVAVTVLPALLLAKGARGALSGWGALDRAHQGRVMGAGVLMGWVALAAMSLVDHGFQLRGGLQAMGAGMLTLPLAALAMLGLFRQRAWGMLAAFGAVGALGASAVGLSHSEILPTGTAMDTALETVASAPLLSAAVPAVLLALLLRPFATGLVKRAVGASESETRVRVETHHTDDSSLTEPDALTDSETNARETRAARG
jgi:hypothetical protein